MSLAIPSSTPVSISPEHRVRHYLVKNIPLIEPEATLADIQTLLWKNPKFDAVNFIYVVNKKKLPIGVISFKDLFRHTPDTLVSSIMKDRALFTVSPQDDDERTVFLALRYGLTAIPVVEFGKIIGVVPAAKLLKILKKDGEEDLAEAKATPTHERRILDDVLSESIMTSTLKRLPWLLVGVGGGIIAARIIHGFEEILAQHVILISFIPLVIFLSGAISAQIQMFYIRDMAIYDRLPLLRYVLRHGVAALALGFLAAIALFILNSLWRDIGDAALVISIATVAATFSAIITGIFVPFILSLVLKDPASASPPIAIIASDILTVLLYFYTASLFL